jgi:hypothetical protein
MHRNYINDIIHFSWISIKSALIAYLVNSHYSNYTILLSKCRFVNLNFFDMRKNCTEQFPQFCWCLTNCKSIRIFNTTNI